MLELGTRSGLTEFVVGASVHLGKGTINRMFADGFSTNIGASNLAVNGGFKVVAIRIEVAEVLLTLRHLLRFTGSAAIRDTAGPRR